MKAIIVDIDWTIADIEHRMNLIPEKYDEWKQEVSDLWDAFHEECHKDAPILPVVEIVKRFQGDHHIMFITGRNGTELNKRKTKEWLSKYFGVNDWTLIMRDPGDHRHDYEIKENIYKYQVKPDYVVEFVLEDRQQCVDMWRRIGLVCLQPIESRY